MPWETGCQIGSTVTNRCVSHHIDKRLHMLYYTRSCTLRYTLSGWQQWDQPYASHHKNRGYMLYYTHTYTLRETVCQVATTGGELLFHTYTLSGWHHWWSADISYIHAVRDCLSDWQHCDQPCLSHHRDRSFCITLVHTRCQRQSVRLAALVASCCLRLSFCHQLSL